MPAGIDVFVEDGFAEITVPDRSLRAQVLNDLLEHTPAALIEKLTRQGRFVVYRVPEGNAAAAGLIDGMEVAGTVPLKGDTGMAAALVAADPKLPHDAGHGEWRSPSNTITDQAYQAMPTTGNGVVTQQDVNNPVPQPNNGKIRAPLRPNKNVVPPATDSDEE